jgi:hypothetical protein
MAKLTASQRKKAGALGAGGRSAGIGAVGRAAEHDAASTIGLDMSEAARAARAREMGFGPHTWYHGTASNVRAFDPATRGVVTGMPLARAGFSFSRDPAVAGDFADLAASSRHAATGQNIIPVKLGMRNAIDMDLKGSALSPRDLAANLQHAIDHALMTEGTPPDTVIFRNMPTHVIGHPPRTSDVAIVLDPTRIRSVLAAFDPTKAHSADLRAGLAAAGLIVPMAGAVGNADAETASATAR